MGNNRAVRDQDDEKTIVGSGGAAPEESRPEPKRDVIKRAGPPVRSSTTSFLGAFFGLIVKLVKVLLILAFLGGLFFFMYSSYEKAKQNDIASSGAQVSSDGLGDEGVAPVSPTKTYEVIIYKPELLKSYARLRITSTPEATIILVNGKKLVSADGKNITSTLGDFQFAPGNYEITLLNTRLGFSRTRTISLGASESKRLDFILKRD